ncbi:uncharacterized protein VP01_436g7 [Puccinia sorghi]|uniref:No apical meristem-associated C-terminal domain-containing protein n=1 Tax=Puccinia sorghi TaxID=27349 RepID=A0A0L6UQL9_9BASI|nr:uncharacterized protein VP01_436g7 [Puccinia sorghi]
MPSPDVDIDPLLSGKLLLGPIYCEDTVEYNVSTPWVINQKLLPKNKRKPPWRLPRMKKPKPQSLPTGKSRKTRASAPVGIKLLKTQLWVAIKINQPSGTKSTQCFKPFPLCMKKPLKYQWYHVQNQASKHCNYYSQVERRIFSGLNCNEFLNTGRFFTLDHCWGILHHSPKWIKHLEEGKAPGRLKKKTKLPILPATSNSPSSADPLSNDAANSTVTKYSSLHLKVHLLEKGNSIINIKNHSLINTQFNLNSSSITT